MRNRYCSLRIKLSLVISVLVLLLWLHFRLIPSFTASYNNDCYMTDQFKGKLTFMLRTIITHFETHDVQYWLDYGTLLGAKRNQGLIPWDGDGDISYVKDDPNIRMAFIMIREQGISINTMVAQYKGISVDLFRWQKNTTTIGENEYFYKYYPPWSSDGYIVRLNNRLDAFPVAWIGRRNKINFLGIRASVPEQTEALLKHRYKLTYYTKLPYRWKCYIPCWLSNADPSCLMSVTISDGVIPVNILTRFYDVISYLYGPNSNHIVINSKTVFSSCDLFTFLSPKCDVIKMMIGYLKNQSLLYKDGGLFVAMVTLNLIRKYRMMDTPLSAILTTNEYAILEIEKISREISVKCNIGKLRDVFTVIKTLLLSKLSLKEVELQHLNILYARIFTSNNPLKNCHVILNDNSHMEDSMLMDGLLLRLDKYFDNNILTDAKNNARVLLFSVSLAIDSEELLGDNKVTANVKSLDTFKQDVVLKNLLDFCRALTPLVEVVICQKVVHPHVKRLFKNHGVICIDRVGGNIVPLLENVLCCVKISTLSMQDMGEFVGRITCLEHVEFCDKSYLKLYSQSLANIKTLLLCGKNENEVNTLHHCYETSMIALKTLTSNNLLVCGGGCYETQLCMRLIELKNSDRLSDHHKYLNVVVSSLLNVSMAISHDSALHHSVDNTFYHHWINEENSPTCCCGAVNKDSTNAIRFFSFLELLNNSPSERVFKNERYFDKNLILFPNIVHSEEISIHNLRSAFELANLVLRIGIKVIPN